MVVGVYKDGVPLKVGAYGLADLENGVPMSRDSVFEICSLTKQFTAAAILLLQQDHKLKLDDPLTRFIPEVPSSWSAITLADLLHHTSGLNDDFFEGGEHDADFRQEIGRLKATVVVPPGTAWEYSNLGYWLLGHVVERASGEPYYRFLRERIFEPLRMAHTGPNTAATLIRHRVRGYAWNGADYANASDVSDALGFGCAGLESTVDDLEKWTEALRTGKILLTRSRDEMRTPATLRNGDVAYSMMSGGGYGLGVFLGGTPGHSIEKHSGSWCNASAQLSNFSDDHLTVIVLTNFGGWKERPWVGEQVARLFVPQIQDAQWKGVSCSGTADLSTLVEAVSKLKSGVLPAGLLSDRLARYSKEGCLELAALFASIDPARISLVRSIRQNVRHVGVFREGSQQIIAGFQPDGRIDSLWVQPCQD